MRKSAESNTTLTLTCGHTTQAPVISSANLYYSYTMGQTSSYYNLCISCPTCGVFGDVTSATQTRKPRMSRKESAAMDALIASQEVVPF